MSDTVYLRGLPRSGTNFLEYLLRENFDIELRKNSKHGIIPIPDQPDVRLCYITKHPIDWIQSLYAYGHSRTNVYISEYDWPKFVFKPIVMLTGSRGMWFRSPVDVWNGYLNHYRSWQCAVHIKLEELTPETLEKLQVLWGLKRKGNLVWTKSSMNSNGKPTGQPFRARRRDGMWKREMIKFVEEIALLEEFGYGQA